MKTQIEQSEHGTAQLPLITDHRTDGELVSKGILSHLLIANEKYCRNVLSITLIKHIV